MGAAGGFKSPSRDHVATDFLQHPHIAVFYPRKSNQTCQFAMSSLQDAVAEFAVQSSNTQPRDDDSSVYDWSVKSESNSSSSEEQTAKPCDGADTSLPSRDETTKKALTLPQDRTAEHAYVGKTSGVNKGEKDEDDFLFPIKWTPEQCRTAKESARSEEGQCCVYLSLPEKGYQKVVLAYEGSALPGPSRRSRGLEAYFLGQAVEDIVRDQVDANPSRYATGGARLTLLEHYLDGLQKYSGIKDIKWLPLFTYQPDKIEEGHFGRDSESSYGRLDNMTGLKDWDRDCLDKFGRIARARVRDIMDRLASDAQESSQPQSSAEDYQ